MTLLQRYVQNCIEIHHKATSREARKKSHRLSHVGVFQVSEKDAHNEGCEQEYRTVN